MSRLRFPNDNDLGHVQREALRAANMLHAEGVLLMEQARGAAAAILALRDNSARPLLGALPVFLSEDGSRARTGPPMLRPLRARPAAARGRGPGGVFGSAGRVLSCFYRDHSLSIDRNTFLQWDCSVSHQPRRHLQPFSAAKSLQSGPLDAASSSGWHEACSKAS